MTRVFLFKLNFSLVHYIMSILKVSGIIYFQHNTFEQQNITYQQKCTKKFVLDSLNLKWIWIWLCDKLDTMAAELGCPTTKVTCKDLPVQC